LKSLHEVYDLVESSSSYFGNTLISKIGFAAKLDPKLIKT